jgi:hypothetical protein
MNRETILLIKVDQPVRKISGKCLNFENTWFMAWVGLAIAAEFD